MNDILDLHTHTFISGHAYNTLYEMIRSASEKGLVLFGSSDHAPAMPGSCHTSYFGNTRVIPKEIYGVRVLIGVELNIRDYDGNVDLKPNQLQKLDYAVASIHDPCYKAGSASQNTNAILGAIKNPLIHIIGHPDDSRFPIDYETVVLAAKEYHTLLEVNSSSLHPQCYRQNAHENYLTMLEFCRIHQVPVILNSDAHVEADVGNHERAWQLLNEINFPDELVVNSSLEKLASFIPKLSDSM